MSSKKMHDAIPPFLWLFSLLCGEGELSYNSKIWTKEFNLFFLIMEEMKYFGMKPTVQPSVPRTTWTHLIASSKLSLIFTTQGRRRKREPSRTDNPQHVCMVHARPLLLLFSPTISRSRVFPVSVMVVIRRTRFTVIRSVLDERRQKLVDEKNRFHVNPWRHKNWYSWKKFATVLFSRDKKNTATSGGLPCLWLLRYLQRIRQRCYNSDPSKAVWWVS